MRKTRISAATAAFCAAVVAPAAWGQVPAQKPPIHPIPGKTVSASNPKDRTSLTTSGAQIALPAFAALRGTLKADKKTLKEGETVTFTYSVTNTSKTAPQTVRFSSGQRFDIMVSAKGNPTSVWQMSQTMRYLMSLGIVLFAPGETKTFTATWRPDNGTIKAGASFTATAYLTAMGTAQSASRPASAILTLSAAPK